MRKETGKIFEVTVKIGLVACLCVEWTSGQTAGVYKRKEEKLSVMVGPQPIPFSHRKHVVTKMSCIDCHTGAQTKDEAGLPSADRCMFCHVTISRNDPAIQKLAALEKEKQKIAWVRIYVLPDFVFFSHAAHFRAGVDCGRCHGAVNECGVLVKEVSTTMISCVNCHKMRKASISCNLCHELR